MDSIALPDQSVFNFYDDVFTPIIFPMMKNFFVSEDVKFLHYEETKLELLRFVDKEAKKMSTSSPLSLTRMLQDSPLRLKYYVLMNVFAEALTLAEKICFPCAKKIQVDRNGNLVNKDDIRCDHPIQGLLFDFNTTANTSQESNFENGVLKRYVVIKGNELIYSKDLTPQVLQTTFFA